MGTDAFTRVQDAELQAVEIVNAARKEAASIIENAEKDASAIINDAIDKARETAARRLDETSRENQSLTEALLADLNKEKEALINKAKTNRRAAIDKILETIAG